MWTSRVVARAACGGGRLGGRCPASRRKGPTEKKHRVTDRLPTSDNSYQYTEDRETERRRVCAVCV